MIKQQDEFSFVGKLYTDENMNFGKWYEDFNATGGFEKLNSCSNGENALLETVHFILPKRWTVYIGIVVDKLNSVPEGYMSDKLPGGEFYVVSSEWKSTNEEAHKSLDESEKNKKIPAGYAEDKANYVCIERFYECPKQGHRWERWYQIKK